MTNALLVFLGGGMGSVLRYTIGLFFRKFPFTLPWATFVANISACFIFALVLWLGSKKMVSPAMSLFFLTGFCGGLSTFSTFGYETFMLIKSGMVWSALLNVAVSTFLALLMFYVLQKQAS